ncbi:MAG: phenylacetate--CoA ligase family protein [Pararhodobacter sp.]|nr:phenylacetate--CoA ligase family protein [Pararhodobacter sp.]
MSRPDRLALLAARVAEAAAHAPALARRLDEAGLRPEELAVPGSLDRLPVLTKDDLMLMQQADPPFAGFLAGPISDVAHVFVSPGPIFEPVLAEDTGGMGMDRMFSAAGIGPDDVALNTWSYHLVPAGLLFDRGLRATGASVIPSGPGQTELQLTLIDALKVSVFVGSSVYFETVADAYARAQGSTAGRWSLKHAFVVGEPGKNWPHRRATLEAAHGVRVHTGYGTADLGLVGYDISGSGGYTVNPDRLVQICDPLTGVALKTGEIGQVVVSTLARGWPMIRFGTGDLAAALETGADGFVTRLGPVSGRVGSGVKVREIFIYPHHLARLSLELSGETEARARITREGSRDVITLELTGPRLPEDAVIAAFRRLTRLGVDHLHWIKRFTVSTPLQDDRQR